MINKYLYPYFKEKSLTLQDVRPMDIEAYYKYLQRDCGLSGNTALKHHQIIYTALKYAVYNRIIKENPCQYVRRPKKEKSKHDFYNAEELKSLMRAVKDEDIETAIYLIVWLGLRRSEVLGLTWNNVDFENHTIAICNKRVRAKQDGKLVTISSEKMKTETSNRVLVMSNDIEDYLHQIKRVQMKNREFCGNCYVDTDYVCVNKMGEPLNPDYLT